MSSRFLGLTPQALSVRLLRRLRIFYNGISKSTNSLLLSAASSVVR